VGSSLLCEVFPILFQVSLQLGLTIKEMGDWKGENWHWRLSWRRNFFSWGEELYNNLLEVIGLETMSKEDDQWVYANYLNTVCSNYLFLLHKFSPSSSLLFEAKIRKLHEIFEKTQIVSSKWLYWKRLFHHVYFMNGVSILRPFTPYSLMCHFAGYRNW
jgi:hypothetical protein